MYEMKMKTISAGPEGTFGIGDIYKASTKEEAEAMFKGGYAEYTTLPTPAPFAPVKETATVAPQETAAAPVGDEAKGTGKVEAKSPAVEAPVAPKVGPWSKG